MFLDSSCQFIILHQLLFLTIVIRSNSHSIFSLYLHLVFDLVVMFLHYFFLSQFLYKFYRKLVIYQTDPFLTCLS
jgi:hypothetical protein